MLTFHFLEGWSSIISCSNSWLESFVLENLLNWENNGSFGCSVEKKSTGGFNITLTPNTGPFFVVVVEREVSKIKNQ